MLTLNESYQLFKEETFLRIKKIASSHTLDENQRSISFSWKNRNEILVHTVRSFREDLYLSLCHHEGFRYAFDATAYVEEAIVFHRFVLFFQLKNDDIYQIELIVSLSDWKIRMGTFIRTFKSDERYVDKRIPEKERSEEMCSLLKVVEKVVFMLPEFRLPVLTGSLRVV